MKIGDLVLATDVLKPEEKFLCGIITKIHKDKALKSISLWIPRLGNKFKSKYYPNQDENLPINIELASRGYDFKVISFSNLPTDYQESFSNLERFTDSISWKLSESADTYHALQLYLDHII